MSDILSKLDIATLLNMRRNDIVVRSYQDTSPSQFGYNIGLEFQGEFITLFTHPAKYSSALEAQTKAREAIEEAKQMDLTERERKFWKAICP